MASSDDQQIWTNTYYVNGAMVRKEEGAPIPLMVGDGFIDPQQNHHRFRVLDIWFSPDRHGFFDRGRHIFLEDVTGEPQDLPGQISGTYFVEE